MKINKKSFIVDYRVENIYQNNSRIIVKNAKNEYFQTDYTREDLTNIREIMFQEIFAIDPIIFDYKYNICGFGIMAIIGFILSMSFPSLTVIPAVTLVKAIKNLIKLKQTQKIYPNIIMLNDRNVYKYREVISDDLYDTQNKLQIMGIHGTTTLEKITKQNLDWNSLEDYEKHFGDSREAAHAKRKKKSEITQSQPYFSLETRNNSFYEPDPSMKKIYNKVRKLIKEKEE